MELIKFINKHEDWKELLQEAPYFLDVKEEDGFTLLKYNQINSDFSQDIVKECRGIILDSNNKIVCWPFSKFFNYGEAYADTIDWGSARVQEKIDGSIIKLWYDENSSWRLSTNGAINAYKVNLNMNELLQANCDFNTFGELFEAAKNYNEIDLNKLNKSYTYMFELVSPYNKVVIAYPEIIINHIGTRDNITGEELDVDIGVRKPKEYPIHTLEDCIAAASELPADQEGYVVVDKYWKRVKVKNPIYLQLHRMVSNNQLKLKDILQMIFENEQEEFLNYFPEYKPAFEDIENKLQLIKTRLNDNRKRIISILGTNFTRKDFALEVIKSDKANSDYYFKWFVDSNYTFEEWIRSISKDSLISKLQMKELDDTIDN